jgi:hypothetical protein
MMRRRRTIAAALALTLAGVAVARHPTANIEILTHDSADPSPHRLQAALDLGIVAIKLLVTWTADHLSH